MRVAVAVLADSANVREGLLSMLSGTVNKFGRFLFPAPMQATLAFSAEFERGEIPSGGRIPVEVLVRTLENDVDENLAIIQGELDPTPESLDQEQFYTSLVFDLAGVAIPNPGRYVVRVTLGPLDPVEIKFRAFLV